MNIKNPSSQPHTRVYQQTDMTMFFTLEPFSMLESLYYYKICDIRNKVDVKNGYVMLRS